MPCSDADNAYQDALAFLFDRIDYERTPPPRYREREYKLDRMRELLRQLGDPQGNLKIVHIAGTKGKGSTAAILSAITTAAGLRTGVYSSPHLDRLEERIAIGDRPCSPKQLVELVSRIRPIVERMDGDAEATGADGAFGGGPTYFELTTALALLHFADQQVDLAILEVGLGGRLDSTNVCQPVCGVITSISYDHMRQLGSTLQDIAGEKAGIIKDGVPLVSGVVEPEAQQVILRRAARHKAPLRQRGVDFDFRYQESSTHPQDGSWGVMDFIDRRDDQRSLSDLTLSLLGRHQAANAAVAIAVANELVEHGFKIPPDAIRSGLANVRCRGRIELISSRPSVVVDAAHNVASVTALLNVLEASFAANDHLLIFASTRGKDVRGMLNLLLPRFDQIVFTRYENNPRAWKPESLLELAHEILADNKSRRPREMLVCVDPATAWNAAQQRTTPDSLIVITGSFFIAAELRRQIVDAAAEISA